MILICVDIQTLPFYSDVYPGWTRTPKKFKLLSEQIDRLITELELKTSIAIIYLMTIHNCLSLLNLHPSLIIDTQLNFDCVLSHEDMLSSVCDNFAHKTVRIIFFSILNHQKTSTFKIVLMEIGGEWIQCCKLSFFAKVGFHSQQLLIFFEILE